MQQRAFSLVASLRSFFPGAMVLAGLTVAGIGTLAPNAFAAPNNPLAGQIAGQVKNTRGVVQMGASVFLYNRFDELVNRSLTNEQGRFQFGALVPDVYSIRVLLASFAPAERRNISVLPSSENRLEINLASVLSTVQLANPGSSSGTFVSEDWKWVLRTSQATRPVLRLLPANKDNDKDGKVQVSSSLRPRALSNSWGVLKLSAGDGRSFAGNGEEDLGTAFAVGTSVAGTDRMQVSGNVAYSPNSTLPAAGLRTSYTHRMPDGSNATLAVTAQQLYLAPRMGSGEIAPALRTLSAAFLNTADVSDAVRVDYGVDFQSVTYSRRRSNVSPFIRVTYEAGVWGRVRFAGSAGGRPIELLVHDAEMGGSVDPMLVALGSLPRLSRSNGRLTMERARNAEIGWDRTEGTRTYAAIIYREEVSNANFMLAAPASFIPNVDLLPDLNSNSSIFNVGSYRRTGYAAAVTQKVGEHAEISVAAGRTGALVVAPDNLPVFSDSQELRAGIREQNRAWVTLRAAATVPVVKTRLAANYGWTGSGALMPAHAAMTEQGTAQEVGVNLFLRQPLPISGVPWRLEATAEIRNLLAQGYLSLGGANSQSILTNAPRAMRGGLNIIF